MMSSGENEPSSASVAWEKVIITINIELHSAMNKLTVFQTLLTMGGVAKGVSRDLIKNRNAGE